MKNTLPLLLILFLGYASLPAQINGGVNSASSGNYKPESAIIDSLDTVVIDMSNATIIFNAIKIPVSIKSDDIVNALDFSFKYDQNVLVYDSIHKLFSAMQAYSFYNTVDSTVRFTSNSLQTYLNDTPIVEINMTMLSGQINVLNFNTVEAYLNGDPCIVKIIDPLALGIKESINEDIEANLYPNPAKGRINVIAEAGSKIRMFDIKGCEVIPSFIYSEKNNTIITEGFPEGIYLVKISDNKSSVIRRVFIEK